MTRAIRFATVALLTLAAAVWVDAGEAGANAAAKEAVKSAETMSPRMRAMLMAAAARKFETTVPAASDPAGGPIGSGAKPENDPSVIRLPDYLVNAPKLPSASEAMSPKAQEQLAMNRYLGSPDGLDRGFLNRFTVAHEWKKIPLIGAFIPPLTDYVTNEERAMQRYREDERRRKMTELLELGASAMGAGDRKLGEQIKRETIRTFRKD